MSKLTTACDVLLGKLTQIETAYPKFIEKYTQPGGAQLDLAGLKKLYDKFDKSLSKNLNDLAKAKPGKVEKLGKEVAEIAELYLKKMENAKKGYMSPKAEQLLKDVAAKAKKCVDDEEVSSDHATAFKKAAMAWSHGKGVQLDLFEQRAKVEIKEDAEQVKAMVAIFKKFKSYEYKKMLKLVSGWDAFETVAKNRAATKIRDSVEKTYREVSKTVSLDMWLITLSTELHTGAQNAFEDFWKEFTTVCSNAIAGEIAPRVDETSKKGAQAGKK